MFKRLIASIICICFVVSNFQYVHAQEFSINQLPVPGTMVSVSAPFSPLALKGLVVNPHKPLEFQFIVDTGRGSKDISVIKEEADQLVKYFLAGLTVPEADLWVNLSPYEKDRMTPQPLGQTELGRDLLAQDYILKQLTASLIYPEKDLGKEFWSRIYKRSQQEFGTTNIPVNTFNKVWILPNEAQVFENGSAAYVTKATLKVMLDEDYLAKEKHQSTQAASISSGIVRQIVLPEIEKEVNAGKNFAPLRQIYQALILAKWYKETVSNALLDTVYTNKSKVAGINLNDPAVKQKIYERYLQAYKKGVFNYIKEDPTPDGQKAPRKYFSGGLTPMPRTVNRNGAMSAVKYDGAMVSLTVGLTVGALLAGGVAAVAQYRKNKALNQLRNQDPEVYDQLLAQLKLIHRVSKLPELFISAKAIKETGHRFKVSFTPQKFVGLSDYPLINAGAETPSFAIPQYDPETISVVFDDSLDPQEEEQLRIDIIKLASRMRSLTTRISYDDTEVRTLKSEIRLTLHDLKQPHDVISAWEQRTNVLDPKKITLETLSLLSSPLAIKGLVSFIDHKDDQIRLAAGEALIKTGVVTINGSIEDYLRRVKLSFKEAREVVTQITDHNFPEGTDHFQGNVIQRSREVLAKLKAAYDVAWIFTEDVPTSQSDGSFTGNGYGTWHNQVSGESVSGNGSHPDWSMSSASMATANRFLTQRKDLAMSGTEQLLLAGYGIAAVWGLGKVINYFQNSYQRNAKRIKVDQINNAIKDALRENSEVKLLSLVRERLELEVPQGEDFYERGYASGSRSQEIEKLIPPAIAILREGFYFEAHYIKGTYHIEAHDPTGTGHDYQDVKVFDINDQVLLYKGRRFDSAMFEQTDEKQDAAMLNSYRAWAHLSSPTSSRDAADVAEIFARKGLKKYSDQIFQAMEYLLNQGHATLLNNDLIRMAGALNSLGDSRGRAWLKKNINSENPGIAFALAQLGDIDGAYRLVRYYKDLPLKVDNKVFAGIDSSYVGSGGSSYEVYDTVGQIHNSQIEKVLEWLIQLEDRFGQNFLSTQYLPKPNEQTAANDEIKKAYVVLQVKGDHETGHEGSGHSTFNDDLRVTNRIQAIRLRGTSAPVPERFKDWMLSGAEYNYRELNAQEVADIKSGKIQPADLAMIGFDSIAQGLSVIAGWSPSQLILTHAIGNTNFIYETQQWVSSHRGITAIGAGGIVSAGFIYALWKKYALKGILSGRSPREAKILEDSLLKNYLTDFKGPREVLVIHIQKPWEREFANKLESYLAKKNLQELTDLLKSHDLAPYQKLVQYFTVIALRQLKDKRAIPSLLELLGSPRNEVHFAAVKTLEEMGVSQEQILNGYMSKLSNEHLGEESTVAVIQRLALLNNNHIKGLLLNEWQKNKTPALAKAIVEIAKDYEHRDVIIRLMERVPQPASGNLLKHFDRAVDYKKAGYDFNVHFRGFIPSGGFYEDDHGDPEVLEIEQGGKLDPAMLDQQNAAMRINLGPNEINVSGQHVVRDISASYVTSHGTYMFKNIPDSNSKEKTVVEMDEKQVYSFKDDVLEDVIGDPQHYIALVINESSKRGHDDPVVWGRLRSLLRNGFKSVLKDENSSLQPEFLGHLVDFLAQHQLPAELLLRTSSTNISSDTGYKEGVLYKFSGDHPEEFNGDSFPAGIELPKTAGVIHIGNSYYAVLLGKGYFMILQQNAAMKANKAALTQPLENGGIDLNKINVVRTGHAITMEFDPAQLNGLMQGDFEGFSHEITNIQFISSPFPLLGVNPAKEVELLAKV